jgi:hypothetical protein
MHLWVALRTCEWLCARYGRASKRMQAGMGVRGQEWAGTGGHGRARALTCIKHRAQIIKIIKYRK